MKTTKPHTSTNLPDPAPSKRRGKNNLLKDRIEKPDTLCLRVRRKLQISQAEMGKLLDVDENTIGNWESGKQQPSKWTLPGLQRLARQNGVK